MLPRSTFFYDACLSVHNISKIIYKPKNVKHLREKERNPSSWYNRSRSAHPILMYVGEISLLIVSVLVITGLANGILSKLRLNNYATTFLIFVIVLLNVRGNLPIGTYSLSLGGVLSVVIAILLLLQKNERGSDILLAIVVMLVNAGITFAYTMHFSENVPIHKQLLAVLLSLLSGLWCAAAAKRSFPACFFAAITGGALGVSLYYFFFRKSGNIGGNYMFAVMWLSAIFGLTLAYLLGIMTRATKTIRADVYYEASELKEAIKDKKKKD